MKSDLMIPAGLTVSDLAAAMASTSGRPTRAARRTTATSRRRKTAGEDALAIAPEVLAADDLPRLTSARS